VFVGMVLGRLGSMMLGLETMAVRYVCMVRGLFVIAVLVMIGRGAMMSGCVLMMLGSFVMMIGMVLGHGILLDADWRDGEMAASARNSVVDESESPITKR